MDEPSRVLRGDIVVREEYSLEALEERFEKLVLHRPESTVLTLAHRHVIANKFANKSFPELCEIVGQITADNRLPLL